MILKTVYAPTVYVDEGKKGWTLIIKAKDYNDAYEKAYKTHGPQVENMIYQLIK